ncbi:GNAT family N-acetyltransferase [Rhodoligotrophos ferricapiens]|uniref:GNAT family N-acetyltransferase n=1 Tax=Rhodoligotrophos ferricapiens TaxID=3069264 RepID=UPI00315CB4D6
MTVAVNSMRVAPEWREIGAADVAAVHELHLAATQKVGRPDLIRPESRAFFEKMVSGAGRIVGLFDDEGLLAYGVLQWDLSIEEDPYGPLGLDRSASLAKLAGTSVRPAAWGCGLHSQLIAWRIEAARSLGFRHLYSTSAPGNHRSWTNLIGEGFGICALKEQYGGHLRFLLTRTVDEPVRQARSGEWCAVEAIGRQRQLLGAGHQGVAWRKAKGAHEIFYAPRH